METPGGESSVDTNDELNKFEVSQNMDSYVVNFLRYSSYDGTLKETCGLRYKDVIAMKFDLVEDTCAFYHGYSRVVGFVVRLSNKNHDSEGRITSRVWVCEKEGFRDKKYMCNTNLKRRPRLQTKVGCKSHFSISLDRDTNKYNVKAFEDNYCHKLATFHEVAWVRSHKIIDTKNLSQIDAMGKCCIRPCLTYEYMVNQKRGYSKIGFTQKDMYNWIDAKRRDEAFENDSHAARMYLQSKVYSENNLYCKFSIDEKDKLANIFWRDSHSLFEYQCFRDVLVFDSTYKTNAYANLLVIFVGANNHHAACVFGVALLSNETVQSYKWVLNTLMESMGHKHPISILTNEIFPNSWHMICG
ncbi:hypothetical protein Dsin_019137 [Dipteronia sinensis]|uniref:Protein FAR1-RELATED SEQUENCE n=1 Tax=Dipteronia sinensis TaxID=43782 RepID=A0AAE0E2S1_9ROSI|nr:hypothetical protein Dsin_019137 [Dipteronia sinensis]